MKGFVTPEKRSLAASSKKRILDISDITNGMNRISLSRSQLIIEEDDWVKYLKNALLCGKSGDQKCLTLGKLNLTAFYTAKQVEATTGIHSKSIQPLEASI